MTRFSIQKTMPKYEALHKETQVQFKKKNPIHPTGTFLTLNSRGGKMPMVSIGVHVNLSPVISNSETQAALAVIA